MRRKRNQDVKLDTFPFLNVMVGMIVVLLLFMMLTMSTRVIESQESSAAASGPTPTTLSPGAARLPRATPVDEGTGQLSDELYQQLAGQLDQLREAVSQRREQSASLARLQTELETEIDTKLDELKIAIDPEGDEGVARWILGKPEEIEMAVDSKVAVRERPWFVEVKSEGLVVHREGKATEYPLAMLADNNSPFEEFLKGVEQRSATEYLLLLVHPNGADAYEQLRKYILDHHSREVREPINAFLVRVYRKPLIKMGTEPFSKEWLLLDQPGR